MRRRMASGLIATMGLAAAALIDAAPARAQLGDHRLHAVIAVDMDLDAELGLEFRHQIGRRVFTPGVDEQIPFGEGWGCGQQQDGKGAHGCSFQVCLRAIRPEVMTTRAEAATIRDDTALTSGVMPRRSIE